MISEIAYGVVPLDKERKKVFLVRKDHWWGFPKGHGEKGETPLQTAKRELTEETGLVVKELILKTTFSERYQFVRNQVPVDKSVTYFVASVFDEEAILVDQKEIAEGKWVSLPEAECLLTYRESRALFREVVHILGEKQ